MRGDHPTDANPFGNARLELGSSAGGPNWVIMHLCENMGIDGDR